MTYPNTPSETFTAIGGWKHRTDPNTMATIYHVKAPGRRERFEARVYRAGQLIETLTATTRAKLMPMIEQQYGGSAGRQP